MTRTELDRALSALASFTDNVYVRCGASAGVRHLADEIHILAQEAERDLPADQRGPWPAAVRAALRAAGADEAAGLLYHLATENLAWTVQVPDHIRAAARRTAARVLAILGPNADWYTNYAERDPADDGPVPAAYTQVTGHVFGGVVAGVGRGSFAVLLQVQQD